MKSKQLLAILLYRSHRLREVGDVYWACYILFYLRSPKWLFTKFHALPKPQCPMSLRKEPMTLMLSSHKCTRSNTFFKHHRKLFFRHTYCFIQLCIIDLSTTVAFLALYLPRYFAVSNSSFLRPNVLSTPDFQHAFSLLSYWPPHWYGTLVFPIGRHIFINISCYIGTRDDISLGIGSIELGVMNVNLSE